MSFLLIGQILLWKSAAPVFILSLFFKSKQGLYLFIGEILSIETKIFLFIDAEDAPDIICEEIAQTPYKITLQKDLS